MIYPQDVVDAILKSQKKPKSAALRAWATRKLNAYVLQEEGNGRNGGRIVAAIKAMTTRQSKR